MFIRRRLAQAPFLWSAFLAGMSMSLDGSAMAAEASNPVTLHSFCQYGCIGGFAPWSGVVEGPDGAYYGTTFGGGNPRPCMGQNYGVGVVYRVTRAGRFEVLHRFNGGTEGAYPEAGLTVGDDGNLYGTTSAGGPTNRGSVFKIAVDGTFTVLHQFDGDDGFAPWSAPVEDAQGNWYGTTLHGGSQDGGTVYEITRDGVFSTLHAFSGAIDAPDGTNPQAGLLLASDGNLYGTTSAGGGIGRNAGTIFRMSTQGALTTLHVFSYEDGSIPEQSLAAGPDGALYGTTSIGGVGAGGAPGFGTIFRIAPDGTFASLYTFNGVNITASPTSALTLGRDGNLYGMQAQAGASGAGTIYRMTTTDEYTDLYDFTGQGSNGAHPEGSLALGSDGALYGTTLNGGKNDGGTVFRFKSAPPRP